MKGACATVASSGAPWRPRDLRDRLFLLVARAPREGERHQEARQVRGADEPARRARQLGRGLDPLDQLWQVRRELLSTHGLLQDEGELVERLEIERDRERPEAREDRVADL